MTQDTPVEALHTILLGVTKYSWHGTHTPWKEKEKSVYAPRLQSTDTQGLSIPAIRAGCILQYANSLIGRQFKILVQMNTFHVHDLVSANQYQLIKATGTLAALLWVPEILDLENYLVCCERTSLPHHVYSLAHYYNRVMSTLQSQMYLTVQLNLTHQKSSQKSSTTFLPMLATISSDSGLSLALQPRPTNLLI